MKKSIRNHIVIEGIDGCGKSSFLKEFKNDVEFSPKIEDGEGGHSPSDWNGITDVTFDASPYDSKATAYIRSLLSSDDDRDLRPEYKAEALLKAFMSDNIIHSSDIKEYFDYPGCTNYLFTDRFIASTLAYQSLDNGFDKTWEEFENSKVSIPGLIVYFDVDVKTSLNRVSGRGEAKEIFEKEATLEKVKENYKSVFKRMKETYGDEIHIVKIDANADVETVYQCARKAIFDYIHGDKLSDCPEYKVR